MVESTPGEHIRVLYVDEDRMGRELIRDSFRQDGEFLLVETSTREELAAQLANRCIDVVLSDFNILGYDGLQLLDSVKAAMPDVPVIIVTGSGSEEIAVEAMKHGAADYVVKNPQQVGRLPAAIRAVLAAARCQCEREMAVSELDRFFELSRDIFCVIESDGRIRRANRAGLDILEYGQDDLDGRNALEFVHQDDRAAVAEQLERLSNHARGVRFTVRCVTKIGATRWLEWSVIRCRAKNRYFVVARDVTERPTNEDHQQEAVVARLKFAGLSPREQEVLRMVAEGRTNKAIALKMSLSEKTVERHRSRGMRKLKLGNVPDLVRLMLLADI